MNSSVAVAPTASLCKPNSDVIYLLRPWSLVFKNLWELPFATSLWGTIGHCQCSVPSRRASRFLKDILKWIFTHVHSMIYWLLKDIFTAVPRWVSKWHCVSTHFVEGANYNHGVGRQEKGIMKLEIQFCAIISRRDGHSMRLPVTNNCISNVKHYDQQMRLCT